MLMPMFFVPFDGYVVLAIIGGVWLAHHYHWPRNATVRRLERLVKQDRGW